MGSLQGYDALQRRLGAIAPDRPGGLMLTYATLAVGELKRNIPRKTSDTSRSLHVASHTETTARIEGNSVALWLETGTGLFGPMHRKIVPKTKKALAFYVGSFGKGGSLRLTGSRRKGAAGAGASYVVVRSTRGMKAQPYVKRSLEALRGKLGLDYIVKQWNDAS